MTGAKILDSYRRIAALDNPPEGMSRSDYDNVCELVAMVDGYGYDYRLPEKVVYPALRYAHQHNLIVEAVPDKETIGLLDGWVFHFEFSEIRRKALRMVNSKRRSRGFDFDSAEYMGIWEKYYVYKPFCTKDYIEGDFPAITGLAHYILIPIDGSRSHWETCLNFTKYDSAHRHRYGRRIGK